MMYEVGKRKVKIPDKEIESSMKKYGLTKDEAVQMWLEDEGITVNAEIADCEKKAKESDVMRTIHGASAIDKTKKTQKERARKENPIKEMVIAEIAKLLPNFAENVKVENIGKLITFSIGDREFKLDLIEKRKSKGEKINSA